MEDYPQKRRKTSPLTSVTLNISNTPTRAASEDGSRSTPARASFMSPTKASLARFHPHLLAPPVSAERKQQDQASKQTQIFGEKQRLEHNVRGMMMNDISTAPQQKLQPVGIMGDSQESVEERATVPLDFSTASQQKFQPVRILSDSRESIEEGATVPPDLGTLPKGDGSHSSPRMSQTPLTELLNARQLQATEEQDPRASPSEPARDEQKVFLDAALVHKAAGSQISISEPMNTTIDTIENETEQVDGPETLLPFTPTKNSLDDTEPRLPSTPSQLGLEAPPSPPKGLSFSGCNRKLKRKKRSKVKSSPLKPRDPSPAMKAVENSHVSGLGPRIPVTSTQQSKTTQPGGRKKKADRPYVAFGSFVFSLELIRYFRASSNSNSYVDFSRQSPTLSQRLALFLPFSRPWILDTESPPHNSTRQKDMGALHVDTIETYISSTTSNEPTLQLQSVALTSPQQLLVVKFQLNTDKETRKNTDLTVSSISPWANLELGQWLRIEALQLDKPIIEQTISRYWELSEIRASCWYRCEQDLKQKVCITEATLDPLSEEQQDTTSLPTKSRPEGPMKNAESSLHPPPKNHAPNPSDTTVNNDPSLEGPPIPRRSLHQHLGQQSMLFTRSPSTSLLITWRLKISPTGAVHSNLSAHAAFPEAWVQAPGGEALGKLGDAFDLLVEDVGVFQAVQVIYNLIF